MMKLSVHVAGAALSLGLLASPGMAQEAEGSAAERRASDVQDPASQDPDSQGSGEPSPLQRYNPQTGTVAVGDVAQLALGDGWSWLDGADGRQFLSDLGNRPGPATLGVALPPDFLESHAFAVYSYADEGHIEDEEQPDWDEMLQQMKDGAAEESEARREAGMQTVELLGWAEPPHYDKQSHKLFWAERLQFEGEDGETLNYNVRVLGRTGHLVVNGVGSIEQLELVAKYNQELLRVTEFVEGQRYSDFDPAYDKIAAYGIGGLVAGKLALKVGLFAKLGVLLLKFLKPILIGVAVLGGVLFKVFGGRKQKAEAAEGA